ncbi:hypothetical protein IEQ44_14685 [Nocardioides sp. Y6]|uniref:DUF4064 domain-containing protein n=1 Tax=Nocardioides malaquae TaxID=2773426 RepID=A0ABR9RWC9_9ACTN|nr:hypothetical protein [Nocardioides malaquae]MBE7325894.1 hypothetical protein [Nocardioides malaquae]
MSEPKELPRPPQVTMLGWMILVGSLLVVVNVFEVIGGIRSLETRDMLEEYLSSGPGSDLGWSIETGVVALRVTATVAAVCAGAAAVLGWFVLRRNRGARLGLSVLALPLFATGVVAGGFLSSLVAASVVLLWMQPARDWFDGKQPRPATPLGRDDSGARNPFARPEATSGGSEGERPDDEHRVPAPTGAPGPSAGGRPVEGFGDRPTWGAGTPTPGVSAPVTPPEGRRPESPYGHAAGGAYGQPGGHAAAPAPAPGVPQAPGPAPWPEQPAPTRRPGAVLVAAILTWIFSGFALVSSLVAVGGLLLAPDQLRGEIDTMVEDLQAQGGQGQEITADMLIGTTVLVGSVMAVFCLVACLAALLLVLRRAQGSVLLMITSAFTAGFCLLAAVASLSPLLLLPAVAAGVVIALLVRKDVRAWLRSR